MMQKQERRSRQENGYFAQPKVSAWSTKSPTSGDSAAVDAHIGLGSAASLAFSGIAAQKNKGKLKGKKGGEKLTLQPKLK